MAVTCEVGANWTSSAVRSRVLGLEPCGLSWPTTPPKLVAIAASHGVTLDEVERPYATDAVVLTGGFVEIQFFGAEKMFTWSISKRLADEPS